MSTTATEPVIPSDIAPSAGKSDYYLLDVVIVIVRRRRIILKVILTAVVASVIVSLLLPVRYKGTTNILPPKENNSIASFVMGTQLGALASLAGAGGGGGLLKDTNDTYVAMLKSRRIADEIIQKFDLQKVYRTQTLTDTEKKLAENSDIEAGQDSIIRIEVEDPDPSRAAGIANAYVQGLTKLTTELLNSRAGQRRQYMGEQLRRAKENLANAEGELRSTQERTGVIQLSDQSRAIIGNLAKLRAQIAAAEVYLDAMNSWATPDNPLVVRKQDELRALRQQLAVMQKTEQAGNGNIFVPTASIPSVGQQYIDKLRNVKFSEALVELISKQYELALLDETNSVSMVQVLDRAAVPQKKSSPKRGLIVFFSTFTGAFLGLGLAFVFEYVSNLESEPEGAARLGQIRGMLSTISRRKFRDNN